ncbi:hypothetical protein GWK47_030173 [Chionoecetes opilio]|uniref:Uncharacterized protein n=1 Tax=Chionoecetes opilio TaxID=41210 RepID=A0A8J4YK78_CHIOP|nr:hypothetical protein GWK47_030173 [Chionoecetes opilio]
MVVDVSALLWTLEWPSQGTVDTFISVFKVWVNARLLEADVHLCFDRYFEYSTKSSTRSARANATRVHQLERKTPLPARDAVLKNSANKKQLNTLLCDAILSDDNFLQHATQNHQLVVTGENDMPTQVSKGRKSPRLDLASTHEEADILITQQAIHLAKKDPESHVRVVCDDTDVFALPAYYYLSEKLQSSLTMQSPIMGRSCIDVKETARKHSAIVPELLALHALTGCDSAAATYGIGKTKAIAVVRKGYTLDQLGKPLANIVEVTEQATAFMGACYGITTPTSSMIKIRQKLWAVGHRRLANRQQHRSCVVCPQLQKRLSRTFIEHTTKSSLTGTVP